MTTPTNQELLLTLAVMLPDVIEFHTNKWTQETDCYWVGENETVRDTELDYLVRLAEERLTADQFYQYGHIELPKECGYSSEFHATVPQRVTALSRVHQPAGREEV